MSRLLLIGAITAVSIVTANAQGTGSRQNVDERSIVPLPAEIGVGAVDAAQRLWVGDAMARFLSDESVEAGRSVSAGLPPVR